MSTIVKLFNAEISFFFKQSYGTKLQFQINNNDNYNNNTEMSPGHKHTPGHPVARRP